jgi:hypothetical protein
MRVSGTDNEFSMRNVGLLGAHIHNDLPRSVFAHLSQAYVEISQIELVPDLE